MKPLAIFVGLLLCAGCGVVGRSKDNFITVKNSAPTGNASLHQSQAIIAPPARTVTFGFDYAQPVPANITFNVYSTTDLTRPIGSRDHIQWPLKQNTPNTKFTVAETNAQEFFIVTATDSVAGEESEWQ